MGPFLLIEIAIVSIGNAQDCFLKFMLTAER